MFRVGVVPGVGGATELSFVRGVTGCLSSRLDRAARGDGIGDGGSVSGSCPLEPLMGLQWLDRSGVVLRDMLGLEADPEKAAGVLNIFEEAMSISGVGESGSKRSSGISRAWRTQAWSRGFKSRDAQVCMLMTTACRAATPHVSRIEVFHMHTIRCGCECDACSKCRSKLTCTCSVLPESLRSRYVSHT